MRLTEEAFTSLVDAGCPDCARPRLSVFAVVAQRLPLLQGELFGSPTWAYKGEDLVRGTYLVSCDACKGELFRDDACPRCDTPGALERALSTPNQLPFPASCQACGSERLLATAYVPAHAVYERKRAQKARAESCPEDPGFHAFRFECTRCHAATERGDGCPVCS